MQCIHIIIVVTELRKDPHVAAVFRGGSLSPAPQPASQDCQVQSVIRSGLTERNAVEHTANSNMGSLLHYHSIQSTSNITEAVLAELGTPHERIILDIKVIPAADPSKVLWGTPRSGAIPNCSCKG